jgi:hypothetical protein
MNIFKRLFGSTHKTHDDRLKARIREHAQETGNPFDSTMQVEQEFSFMFGLDLSRTDGIFSREDQDSIETKVEKMLSNHHPARFPSFGCQISNHDEGKSTSLYFQAVCVDNEELDAIEADARKIPIPSGINIKDVRIRLVATRDCCVCYKSISSPRFVKASNGEYGLACRACCTSSKP